MMYETFISNMVIQSQNKFTNKKPRAKGRRKYYHTPDPYAAYRDGWYVELLSIAGIPRKKTKRDTKIYCQITSIRKRRLDKGNLIGGSKPIPDGLKKLGWIHDDFEDYFSCLYKQKLAKKGPQHTIIEIADYPFVNVETGYDFSKTDEWHWSGRTLMHGTDAVLVLDECLEVSPEMISFLQDIPKLVEYVKETL